MMKKTFDIAVVGATGVVGEAMLEILAERKFPVGKVHALASERSVGKTVTFGNRDVPVGDLADFDFSQVQIGLFSAGGSISARYAPIAAAAGCVVIDNTSHFRYDDDIPLVVPEVNADAIAAYTNRGIIANPNCSTIQLVVALKPIYDAAGIERINVATYQAVSGAGRSAVEELVRQTTMLLNGRPLEIEGGKKQIAFNAVPHIDDFQDNRYTKEEMKMVWETRKIFADDSILVNPTAVRIPAFYGHSEAVHLETRDKISAAEVCELLRNAAGVTLLDGVNIGEYPTAVTESSGNDPVYVGRVREDISHPRGIDLWVVADNIRKGAALNSVQIAEILAKNHL
ncbi:MAG: aspartate-semialdehyde dehydrogenase [Gammaproteobacteria bacterium]|nr:aspartate-semialdehyde dehydrogenase [Gammaproteobacteria bacterium]MDH3432616.1 aspartate-semialdehyde dehydrogenase [Gammaproteobacteria bacterium]